MTIINPKIDTKIVHAGDPGDPSTCSIATPIYLSSVYRQKSPGSVGDFEYGRVGNPTRLKYEQAITELEHGREGFAFASGVAAINAVIDILKANTHIIAIDALYGGTYRLFEEVKKETSGHTISYLDLNDISKLEQALQKNTRMVWLETPSNPLLKIVDIKKLSEFCKKNDLILVVDNTFATPYNQTPILFGADIVVHSASKYIGGHSDVIGGIVVVNDREDLIEKLRLIQLASGNVASPFDSFLAARGLRTLSLRMRKHNDNALFIAKWLANHDLVKKVYYPGLPNSTNYQVAKNQMRGFGGIVSLELEGGVDIAKQFLENLNLFAITVSVGGVESLSSVPSLMSHSSIPQKIRLDHGISDELIRLSIGIEDVNDLINDIKQAFSKLQSYSENVSFGSAV